MAPKEPKKKQGQPPPVDKLIKPAVGVALALLVYQFIKGLKSDIQRVNVIDELELREVFFGEGDAGKSYALLCHAEDSKIPISSVFQDAYNDGSAPVEFRLVDCNYVLPSSGKSIADRFKLNLKTRPTIFISGAGLAAPQQIPAKHLKTGDMLVKVLRSKFELHAAKIETTQDLRSKCLDKDICGLLLKGATKAPSYLKDAMSKLLKEYPAVAFASMDASVLYALNLEEYLPELQNEQPRFVVFKKISGSLQVGSDRLITSIAPLPTNGVSYGQMSNLVAGVVRGSQEMTKLSSLPMIKTHTKKLEQEERAKRQRRQERQRQQDSAGRSAGSSGAFEANDGSRDGRRAERERRREEHRKTHNVKEKTPEEIAEIERRRRERMAAEEARWNVAPDDAPEEGDPLADGEQQYADYMDYDMGNGETVVVEDSGEDDDDVIDLD